MRVKISYESENILKLNLKMAEALNDADSTAFIRRLPRIRHTPVQ